MTVKSSVFLLLFVIANFGYSQNTNLVGEINGNESLENIHVINSSQKLYTTTSDEGDFEIEAVENDTIIFTSVQYSTYKHIVTVDNIKNKTLDINMEVHVNDLPEVLIGFTLTGNLNKDVLNSDAKRSINFYDVGIPGYTGKKKTKSERVLNEATTGGGFFPLNPLLNAISGRTKRIKKRIELEENTKLMNALKSRLSEAFFKENQLKEDLKVEFFFFCAEDKTFINRCAASDLEALKFMKEKYVVFKENLNLKE